MAASAKHKSRVGKSNQYLLHQHENDYNKRNKTGGMTYDDA